MVKKDWMFETDRYICDLRAAAVLVKNHKILVQREKDGNVYALPGGHIRIGETLEAGLIREIAEEVGAKIECRRLLWSEECFWEWNGKQVHNIAFYYLAEPCESLAIADEAFIPQKDNGNVLIGWMPIGEIQNATIYPEFLKQEIFHLNAPIKHFVSRA